MPQVKLLKMWKGFSPGKVLNLTPGEIEILKRRGILAKRPASQKEPDQKDSQSNGNENKNAD